MNAKAYSSTNIILLKQKRHSEKSLKKNAWDFHGMLSQQKPRHCSREGKKTDKGKQQTSASFGDAALRRSNAKQFKCTLNSQRIKKHFISNRRKKKHIISARGSIFHLTVRHRSLSLSRIQLHLLTDEKLNPALNVQFFDFTGQMKALKVREWCNMSW